MKGIAILLLLVSAKPGLCQQPPDVVVTKIWDDGQHNAFTDLIRFKGKFYCSFREGASHVPRGAGTDGKVRIIRSADGKNWESVAVLAKEGVDLRDPKLSVTPSGQLMVMMGGSIYEGSQLKGFAPRVSFSDKTGMHFSPPEDVVFEDGSKASGSWIWRVTWHHGVGYGIDYGVGAGESNAASALWLVSTTDGKQFKRVSTLDLDGSPNEATIRFHKDGTMHVLIRREAGDRKAVMATSRAPFTSWAYEKLAHPLGGPNFLFDRKQRLVVGGRLHEPEAYTAILTGDTATGLEEAVHLPSKGDNSYPGMAIHKNKLWFSYYSSHEGKTSIYFTTIPLRQLFERMIQ
ncbi:sialidase family protein [Parapedobacter sp. 2B3]|uniref:sialidase family protein n=1 Tax=Parapedobacter sp. 2B3 TaxID=3342381 RepID=UPI0035B69CAB